jgi:putative redox protein
MFRTQVSRHLARSSRLPLRQFSTSTITLQKVPFRIDGEGTGVAQTVSVHGSPHKISIDAYPSFGGKDSAPTPLAYSLTALSSCTQVTGSLVAKDLGIKLGKWRVTVKGDLPTAVLVKGEQGNANWDNIELQVRVQTDGDEAKFQKFADETERRCPITQLFKRSGAGWKSQWVNESL